ncbi:MAG: hypothetical protein VXY34_04795 [Bdellovibrionota bacterium]|nr:hypothetical protein [Bdellovibrionota bacterium]
MRLFTIFFFLTTLFKANASPSPKGAHKEDPFIDSVKKKLYQKLSKSFEVTPEGSDIFLVKGLALNQSLIIKTPIISSLPISTGRSLYNKVATFKKRSEV